MTKKVYRVRNWKDYNQTLINRGSLSIWFDKDCIDNWSNTNRTGQRGRPEKYNDVVIECALTLKAVYKLTFRQTEGFMKSLLHLMGLSLLEVPDYTLFCKRQKGLKISLPTTSIGAGKKINIVVDSTGLKVYGEGEWKVRQHGYIKKRLWRKLHIALNPESHEIEAFDLTDLGGQDWESVEKLLNDIDKPIEAMKGDGAYDRAPCYELAEQNEFKIIVPPQKNAKPTYERGDKINKRKKALLQQRDKTIEQIREVGRKEWKIKSGYHERSLAETIMFRIKAILGNRLTTRIFENQKVEAAIWCKIMNKITQLGMPLSMAID